MKTPTANSLLLGCFAFATGTLLTNCVDPYAQNYGSRERAPAYRTGYEVRSLPPGYRTETIGGTRYYNHNGTYYRPQSGRYVVVEAPRYQRSDSRYNGPNSRYNNSGSRYDHPDGRYSQTVTRLPRGYREINYRGTRYYQSNNIYYQQKGSGYVIVARPY